MEYFKDLIKLVLKSVFRWIFFKVLWKTAVDIIWFIQYFLVSFVQNVTF